MTNEEKILAIREKLNIVNQGLLDPEKYKMQMKKINRYI